MPQPNTVQITAPIDTTDITDTYPTHKASRGQGGYMSVADITARNAISSDRREVGMTVWVMSESKMYSLIGGIDNANWVDFTAYSLNDYIPTVTVRVSGLELYKHSDTEYGISEGVMLVINNIEKTQTLYDVPAVAPRTPISLLTASASYIYAAKDGGAPEERTSLDIDDADLALSNTHVLVGTLVHPVGTIITAVIAFGSDLHTDIRVTKDCLTRIFPANLTLQTIAKNNDTDLTFKITQRNTLSARTLTPDTNGTPGLAVVPELITSPARTFLYYYKNSATPTGASVTTPPQYVLNPNLFSNTTTNATEAMTVSRWQNIRIYGVAKGSFFGDIAVFYDQFINANEGYGTSALALAALATKQIFTPAGTKKFVYLGAVTIQQGQTTLTNAIFSPGTEFRFQASAGISGAAASLISETNLVRVGGEGNDANNGLTINSKKLTFPAAISYANSVATINNRIVVSSEEAMKINTPLTLTNQYVYIYAPQTILDVGDDAAVYVNSASGDFFVRFKTIKNAAQFKWTLLIANSSAASLSVAAENIEASDVTYQVFQGTGANNKVSITADYVKGAENYEGYVYNNITRKDGDILFNPTCKGSYSVKSFDAATYTVTKSPSCDVRTFQLPDQQNIVYVKKGGSTNSNVRGKSQDDARGAFDATTQLYADLTDSSIQSFGQGAYANELRYIYNSIEAPNSKFSYTTGDGTTGACIYLSGSAFPDSVAKFVAGKISATNVDGRPLFKRNPTLDGRAFIVNAPYISTASVRLFEISGTTSGSGTTVFNCPKADLADDGMSIILTAGSHNCEVNIPYFTCSGSGTKFTFGNGSITTINSSHFSAASATLLAQGNALVYINGDVTNINISAQDTAKVFVKTSAFSGNITTSGTTAKITVNCNERVGGTNTGSGISVVKTTQSDANVIYVAGSSTGDDAFSGRSPLLPKATFAAAQVAAKLLSPTFSNQIGIKVIGSPTFVETIAADTGYINYELGDGTINGGASQAMYFSHTSGLIKVTGGWLYNTAAGGVSTLASATGIAGEVQLDIKGLVNSVNTSTLTFRSKISGRIGYLGNGAAILSGAYFCSLVIENSDSPGLTIEAGRFGKVDITCATSSGSIVNNAYATLNLTVTFAGHKYVSRRSINHIGASAWNLVWQENGAICKNTGAGNAIDFRLPSAASSPNVIGCKFLFYVEVTGQNFEVSSPAAMDLWYDGTAYTELVNAVKGSFLTVECVSATEWVVSSVIGTWA